ncbi:MAG: hypothetical protein NVSMB51_00230 [Solirubrobacteraceae bacterium]
MRSFAVLADLLNGRGTSLREALGGFRPEAFAAVSGTHFARFALLDTLPVPGLLFSAEIDGDEHAWVGRLAANAGPALDGVLGHCEGFPGSADPGPLWRWFAERRCQPGFSILSYGAASVEQVTAALELQRRVRRFAEQHQGAGAGALRRAWQEQFG